MPLDTEITTNFYDEETGELIINYIDKVETIEGAPHLKEEHLLKK